MNQTYYIYGLINPLDGKCFYVGQSRNPKRRIHAHYSKQNNDWMKDLFSDFRKHGIKPRNIKIEIFDSTTSKREANWKEQDWIHLKHKEGFNLGNYFIQNREKRAPLTDAEKLQHFKDDIHFAITASAIHLTKGRRQHITEELLNVIESLTVGQATTFLAELKMKDATSFFELIRPELRPVNNLDHFLKRERELPSLYNREINIPESEYYQWNVGQCCSEERRKSFPIHPPKTNQAHERDEDLFRDNASGYLGL